MAIWSRVAPSYLSLRVICEFKYFYNFIVVGMFVDDKMKKRDFKSFCSQFF